MKRTMNFGQPIHRLALVGAILGLPMVAQAQPPTSTSPSSEPVNTSLQQEPALPEDQEDLEPTLPPIIVTGDPDEGQGTDTTPFDTTEVVTPTATPQPARRFGGTVRVIGPQEIRESGARNMSDLLRQVPGVDVVASGPPGGQQSIFLRGANSQHTKVMVDGIPINDPSAPSRGFDAANFALDNVERIEVLQGPQSLLYGSEAIGGVINIITKRGEGPLGGSVQAEGGAYGTHREAIRVSGGNDLVDYSVAGSWLQTEGFSAAAGGPEKDGYDLGTVTGNFGARITDDLEVIYRFRYLDARAEVDDASFSLGQPPTDNPNRLNLTDSFFNRVMLRANSLDGYLVHELAFGYVNYNREDTDEFFPSTFEGATRRMTYQANAMLAENHVMTFGTEHWNEEANSFYAPGPADYATQNQTGVFIQDQLTLLERLHLTAGVRWDENSQAGNYSTYRTTAAYEIEETGTRIRGSLGTGFRAPALAENLFPFGNPDLRPETSRGWEYGIDQSVLGDNVLLGATYFRNDIDNLILFDPVNFILENIGEAKAHGVELTGNVLLTDDWSAWGSYTRTDTRDGDTGEQLVRRPRNKGALGISRRIRGGLNGRDLGGVTLAGRYVGSRLDARDGSVVLDDYVVFDIYGDLWLRDNLRWYYRGENIFNQQYEEITGFNTANAAIYSGLEWTF
ncbi:MAG: TonB-dependent receptor [Pirellulaceae bacterium]